MANVDRPDGFRFIKSLSGNPMNSLVRDVQPGSDDLYIGDPISITSGVMILPKLMLIGVFFMFLLKILFGKLSLTIQKILLLVKDMTS